MEPEPARLSACRVSGWRQGGPTEAGVPSKKGIPGRGNAPLGAAGRNSLPAGPCPSGMFRTCLGAPGAHRVPPGSFRIAKALPGPAPVPVVAPLRLILVQEGLRRILGTWHRPCSTGPAWRVCEVSRDWSWVDGRPARGGHPLHPARAKRAPSAPIDLPSDARRSAKAIRPTRPGVAVGLNAPRSAFESSGGKPAATVNSALKSAWNRRPNAARERPPVRHSPGCETPSREAPKRPPGRPSLG